jgi:hypothetical protein
MTKVAIVGATEPKGLSPPSLRAGLPSTAWGFDRGRTTMPHRNAQLGDYYSAIYNPRVHKTTGVMEMISVAPGDPEMVFGLNNKALVDIRPGCNAAILPPICHTSVSRIAQWRTSR